MPNTARPRFSVVMPAYNVELYIREAVASVLKQDVADWELIIVDDASEDNTLELARGIHDGRIRLFSRPHSGLGASLNFGLEQARGEFVIFFDSDDILASEALRKLGAALTRDPAAVAVYTNYWVIGERGRTAALRNLIPRPGKPSGDLFRKLLSRNVVAALGGALIRTLPLRRIGAFDASIVMGVDWEMWCRLSLVGPIIYANDFRALSYRQRAASITAIDGIDERKYLPAIEKVFNNPRIASRIPHAELARLHEKQIANAYCLISRKLAEAGQFRRSVMYLWRATRLDKGRFPHLAAGLISRWVRL